MRGRLFAALSLPLLAACTAPAIAPPRAGPATPARAAILYENTLTVEMIGPLPLHRPARPAGPDLARHPRRSARMAGPTPPGCRPAASPGCRWCRARPGQGGPR